MTTSRQVPSRADVIDVIMAGGADVGLDKQASSSLIANLNATTLPMCVGTPIDEIETDDTSVLLLILDASPSMGAVEQDVIDGFNNVLIPGLKGGSSKIVSTIEVGGLSFTEKIWPMWGSGFQKLENLPPLTRKDYDTSRGNRTALYQAVYDGLTAVTARATKIMQETGIPPKVWVVVISDGANNCLPYDAAKVREITEKLSKEIFVLAFAGFETGEPVDFKAIAVEMGFSRPFEMKRVPGESDSDMGRRFRHLLGVVSSHFIRDSQNAVNANSGSAFWDPGANP